MKPTRELTVASVDHDSKSVASWLKAGALGETSPRTAAEQAIAEFQLLDPASQESEEAFIHLVVARGFKAHPRRD